AEDAAQVVAVPLPALAREYPGGLRSGIMDAAQEVSSFGDSFTPWDEPEAEDTALVHDGDRTAYEELFPATTWVPGSRVLVTGTSAYQTLTHLLHALATGSSLVLVRGPAPPAAVPAGRARE